MSKPFPVDRYDLSAYDVHLCLKLPRLVYAATVFLCRDFVLPVMIGLISFRGGSRVDLSFLLGDPDKPGRYLTALPALLVLIAMVRRKPGAHAVFQWLWRQGHWLLALAAIAQITTAASGLDFRGGSFHYDSVATLLLIGADCVVFGYVLLSRRVRDAFADYPQPKIEQPKTPRPQRPRLY